MREENRRFTSDEVSAIDEEEEVGEIERAKEEWNDGGNRNFSSTCALTLS
ncbi:MAG: hypothetical protein QGG73_11545 [Candidatus Hydrogenedentes bacterium]|jgi:hypothetical protein|nr:hypothetical protein [Candidatus Hydrogenedentota bacterium]